MIDETKTKPAKPNDKPAAAKSAKPADASAARAASEPAADKTAQDKTAAAKTAAGKPPEFVKVAPAVPARNPLKPKPATPVVPVDRVRPSETKAAPASVPAEPVAATPAPVPATMRPAPVVMSAEPAVKADAAEAMPKPLAATAPTAKASAPVKTEAQPAVTAEAKPVVAAPVPQSLKPAPARYVKAAPNPGARTVRMPAPKTAAGKAPSSEIIDIPAAFEAFRKPAEAVGEEWPKTLRTLAATGLDQTRDTYRRMRRSAERLGEGFEDGAKTAQTGLQEFQIRGFDAVRSQTDATLGFMTAMTEVRSLSDAIELNASYARRRYEDASTQAKTLAAVANRTIAETGETVRKAMTESLSPRG